MSRSHLLVACASVVLAFAATGASPDRSPTPAAGADRAPTVVHQLRIYQIFDSNKQAFHQRFRNDAMRIMARYDFRIVATWESRQSDRTEFVYLLEWPDEVTMKDRWARFLADQEWIELKRVTGSRGPLVGDIADRTLTLTEYSPHRSLVR